MPSTLEGVQAKKPGRRMPSPKSCKVALVVFMVPLFKLGNTHPLGRWEFDKGKILEQLLVIACNQQLPELQTTIAFRSSAVKEEKIIHRVQSSADLAALLLDNDLRNEAVLTKHFIHQ